MSAYSSIVRTISKFECKDCCCTDDEDLGIKPGLFRYIFCGCECFDCQNPGNRTFRTIQKFLINPYGTIISGVLTIFNVMFDELISKLEVESEVLDFVEKIAENFIPNARLYIPIIGCKCCYGENVENEVGNE